MTDPEARILEFLKGTGEHLNGVEAQKAIEDGEKEYKDSLEKYDLWREYLKRSDTYIKVCEWIRETKESEPYPMSLNNTGMSLAEEDFYTFLGDYLDRKAPVPLLSLAETLSIYKKMGADGIVDLEDNSFFMWAVNVGFPFEYEMIMNYFIFGDVFDGSELAKALATFKFILIIELRITAKVFELHKKIDLLFLLAEMTATKALGKEPTVKDFQQYLKRILKNDSKLHITINDPHENKDDIIGIVSKIIDRRRNEVREFDNLPEEKDQELNYLQFECPSTHIRIDELKRYLKAYDLKKEGMTNKKAAKTLFPDYPDLQIDNAIRMTQRDVKKAKNIIKNVEKGFFPGKYQ